ncbi:NUDIX hydrolase [Thalassococcus lentus]|uniref:NUDIX hydrolase n=1 Tax=Thalassococcus lentus TaxID=1210524 RepID=A0ABT4XX79_9RHOB|nr:NUDIX hydrolase [Thalassococcus lentus]MDA7426543.1 NUDIX hydrolase [Thalassococcus lentus]
MLQRPKKLQVAALCHRGERNKREYLLVTSRGTKRWIIPKGWPIRGLASNEAALQEAWEEAGVKSGQAKGRPSGTYTYQKRQNSGWSFPVETLVYSVSVEELAEDYPEADQRTRTWVSAEKAADMVDEPQLQQIFRDQTG